MSRHSLWLSVVLVSTLAAAGASACPGTFAIGLPLLFGSEEPTSPWPAPTDFRPIIDLKLPAGFDEAQDAGEPLGRKGLAQECLKVWRQLVREGRFDLAPIVAAKAASLDPTNIDVQQAIIVSQVLRQIDDMTRQAANKVETGMATKRIQFTPLRTASGCEADAGESFKDVIVPAGRLAANLNAVAQPACPDQCPSVCPVDDKSAPLTRSFQVIVPFSLGSSPALPGTIANKYVLDMRKSRQAAATIPSDSVLPTPQQVQTMWEHRVVVMDNVQCVAGRIYLFADGKPHVGNGTLTVFAHEVLSDNKTRPYEAWEIDRVTLQKLGGNDVVGWGYTVFLPLSKQGAALNRLQLQVRFTPDNGLPLASQPVTVSLSDRREANVVSGYTAAGRLAADLNVPIKASSFLENATELLTENEIVAQRALKHLFPGGILATTPACETVCPAANNVVAAIIPARRVPDKYLAPSKDDLKQIPLTSLGHPKPNSYRLAAGDVLGVHIDGVLGEPGQGPKVQKSDDPDFPPGVGYPIPVRDDGTVSLPLLPGPLNVDGKSLTEVEKIIRNAYTEPKEIVNLDKARVLISLLLRRSYTVKVIREEMPQTAISLGANASRRAGAGTHLSLPAYQNDILNALTRTGGLPHLDGANDVRIERRLKDGSTKNIRIPLRLRACDQVPFEPSDVILEHGDVIFIEKRETEVVYIDGPQGTREFTLPRDRDMRVIQALTVAQAAMRGGQSALNSQFLPTAKDVPSPIDDVIVVRQTNDDGQIRIQINVNRAMNDPREDIILQRGDVIVFGEKASSKPGNHAASPRLNIYPSDTAPQAGTQSSICTVGHAVPSAADKRVTIKTAAWLVECDRMVLVNDRELLVEGNVNLLLRQRDMTVRGGRIRINLADGSFQVDGIGSFFGTNNAP